MLMRQNFADSCGVCKNYGKVEVSIHTMIRLSKLTPSLTDAYFCERGRPILRVMFLVPSRFAAAD